MTTPDDGKAFLQLCLTKRLLDKPQAKEIWVLAQQSGASPQHILIERGVMASHTVAALEKELKRAQEPRAIGGFEVIKTLGQGGMATVFLARQVSLGREVALKLMSPQIATNPEAADRFLREARVAATVNHPNVVSIIDVGQSDGQLYMALELVTGGDAAQLATRFDGKLPEARALELLIDCAKGLQALYEARLVHRDLKPSNIFITGDGVAKLGDLGLARSEDGADRMTITGHLVGTPAFMSPEQASGESTVDIRSDIYSLGATLFALVAGRPPFIGNSPIAVAAKALTEAVPDPRSLVPNLSAASATLILRAMAKKPGERFQTPRDLRDALEQALAQAPHGNQRVAARSSATAKPSEPPTPVTIPGNRRAPVRASRRSPAGTSWMVIAGIVLATVLAVLVFFKPARPAAATPATTTSALANEPLKATAPAPAPAPPVKAEAAPVAKPEPVPAPKPEPVPAPTPVLTTTTAIAATPLASGVAAIAGVESAPPQGTEPPRVPWATAQGKDVFGHWITITINGIQQRLRWLPPGTCVIGSPATEPGHNSQNESQSTVTFTFGTWMADTECTEALWHAVTKRSTPGRDPRLPIVNIKIAEVIAFTHALRPLLGGAKARLPSRAEWERACRAGSTTTYSTGNDVVTLKGYANLFDLDRSAIERNGRHLDFSDGHVDLAPVASLRPNRWGYFDMHGNVAEFCLAMWTSLPPTCVDPLINDAPEAQQGFIRGGAYDTEGANVCRSAALPYVGREAANQDIGFRFLIESPH